MGQKWIIDVLADLEAFAQDNGLPGVAERLRETAKVAQDEVRAMSGEVADGTNRSDWTNGAAFSEA